MQVNESTIIQLNLTLAEVNVILKSLGKHPFDEISYLIENIRNQGELAIQHLTEQEDPA